MTTASLSSAKHFFDSDPVSTEEVEATLSFELGTGASPGRIESHKEALRSTYSSLPKNAHGNLGHQAVRYVLHRYFVQRSGWYIKGLEPTNDTWYSNSSAAGLIGSVPSFIQGRLEKHLGGHGINLHGLATLAVVMEDLIHKEAVTQIRNVYEVLQLPLYENISIIDVQEAIDTYMMIHLVSRKVTLTSPHEAAYKRERFSQKYKNFSDVHAWVQKVEQPHFTSSLGSVSPRSGLSFPEVSRMVEELGEKFGVFNDLECHELKTTLLGMESRKEGRIRLADFYNKSFLSHWRFTEKVDYLRDLGALDESDPKQPLVLIANYLSARPNCLEATGLYAVCCRNECEDLFGSLEKEIGGPTETPEKIASLVANLSSDTVTAPRELSKSLLGRLQEIAARTHDGKVNLHGRLFGQFMSHAFPRECPYPHEAGSTNPQSADEWIKSSGHQSEQASEEEMKKIIEDACPVDQRGGCGGLSVEGKEEAYDLPWSVKEELLVTAAIRPQEYEHPSSSLSFLALIAVGLFIVWLLVARTWKTMTLEQRNKLGIFLLICWFTWACIFAGILDMAAFICPVAGGLVMLLTFRRQKVAAKPKQCDV